jgi:hypothetical protein
VLPVTLAQPAFAQLADVVTPDEEGNFDSSSVQGARGFYPQKQWLVVDRGAGGLRCRDGNGTVLVGLRYGSVIDTDLSSKGVNPITSENGKPWLRVRVTPADFQADYRDRRFLNQPAICKVRAHVNYLAPINPDTLTTLRLPLMLGRVGMSLRLTRSPSPTRSRIVADPAIRRLV